MVRWLPTFGKVLGGLETKDAPTRRASQGRGYVYRDQSYVPPGANVDRMVRDGYERVIWAFKAIDATADKMSSWPIECMEGLSPKDWKSVDDPCLPLLNGYANQIERSAKYFRYRVVSQLLLSKRGVFVEVVPSNGGGIAALNLLPPGLTAPIPDPDKFLAGFRVEMPGDDKLHVDLPVYDPDKRAGVIWIRKPHPTDPYSSITPLEAAGISLDLDFYARLYNRNFLVNDGRAGQIVAVKGGLSPEDAAELKARFSPGMGGAGRTSVIEADAISVEDTAVSPRDAQYAQLRNITKEDLLIALGTPESVIGNASGRTFDNADAEKENWLDVTVLPLSQVVESGFDALTKGGWGDDRRIVHDTSSEPVLQRAKQRRIDRAAQDVTQGLRTRDEFREIAELDPFDTAVSRTAWAPITGMTPVGKAADVTEALKLVGEVATANQPTPPGGSADPAAGDPGGLEGFDPGIMSDPALPQALSEVAGDPPADLTAAAADLELELKKFNPAQPRYPTGHPQGGKFMDEGDVALWLAGKPLKGGFPSGAVVNPNRASTASPASVAGGAGGATRFFASPDPKVRAAAAVLSFPANYPYPRVLGAPPASIVNATPKPTKVVSLRKGDVVRMGGSGGFGAGDWAVADAKRKGGGIDLTLVNDQGQVRHVPAASGAQTLDAVARTPHPTTVADAKRTISAAHHGAAGSTPAGQAPSVTPTPQQAPAPAAAAPAAAPAAAASGTGPFPPSALTTGAVFHVHDAHRVGQPVGTTLTIQSDGSAQMVTPSATTVASPAVTRAILTSSTSAGGWTAGPPPANLTAPTGPPSPLSTGQARAQTVAGLGGTPGTTLAGRITRGQQWVASDGTVLTMAPSGLLTVQPPTGGTGAHTLGYLHTGAGARKQWAAVAGSSPPPNVGTPPVAAPAAPSPPVVAPQAAGAVPAALPASIAAALGPNTQVFRHPQQGKVILVQPGGTVQAFKADGSRASTSATAAKLAAGHGAWTQISHAQLHAQYGGARGGAATPPPPTPAAAAAPTHTTPAAPAAPTIPQQPAAVQAPTPPPSPAAAPSTTGSVAAKVVSNGVPQIAVSSTWQVTGTQKGSNAAAEMTAPGGRRFYVKSQDALTADNEVGANRLYAAAGVEVPTVHRARIIPGVIPGQKGREGIASEIVAGTPTMAQRMQSDPKFRDAVHEDFAVHAWLGNWDAVENNNTMVGTNGRPLTVDAGGAMLFRARGGRRPMTNTPGGFGSKVQELDTMRTTTGSQKATFGQVKTDSTDARFVRGVERVAAISPQQVRDLVDQSYPSMSTVDRADLANTLIARRADLASRAGVVLPENRPAAAPARAAVAAPAPAAPTPIPAAAPAGPSILTYPPNYPYPVVSGAPPASAIPGGPKAIKIASLRKGDVIRVAAANAPVSVVSVDRRSGDITVLNNAGQTSVVRGTSHPTGNVMSVARTPHPQKVAAARRAQTGAPAPTPPAAAPTTPAPAAPAAAAPSPVTPTFQAPPAPVAGPAGAPPFTPAVARPASGFVDKLQAGQVFIHPKTGNRMVINANGTGDLTIGARARGGTPGTKTPAMTARTLKAAGWQADSGPDIDTPGPGHAAAVRKAMRNASLPPVGTPYRAATPGGVYPPAATGTTTPTARSNVTRGMTVRVGGEDWIVTETGSAGLWGYRPGVDDPNILVRQTDDSYLQGSPIPGLPQGHFSVDVVGAAPSPAVNVPSNGTARGYDVARGPVASDPVGHTHGTPFTFDSQLVPADQLRPGDVILLNGREGEGSFVVDRLDVDHKGRQNVVGYAGTTADVTGVPGVPAHLMLTGPSGHIRQVRVQVNGAVSAPPVVPRPDAPKAPATIARRDISDPTSQTAVANIMAGRVPPPSRWPKQFASTGDRKLALLMEMRGYHEFPDVVSESELDSYVDDGEIELFRGMTPTPGGPSDLAEEFRTGTHYTGGNGGALFGTGQYAGYGTGVRGTFNYSPNAPDFARSSYAGGGGLGSVVTRMTIKADARVAEFDALYAEMKRQARTNPAVQEMADMGNAGVGHFAVYMGYDVIRAANGYKNRHGSPGKSGDDWDGGFIVILNRSAIRVTDKNYVAPSVVGRAPGGQNPPPKSWDTLSLRKTRGAKHDGDVDFKRVKAVP